MNNTILVNKASEHNIDDIVLIHCRAFPEFFLTSLGTDFLKLYYRCMIKFMGSIVLCAYDGNKVVGFSATALRSKGFYKIFLLRNIIPFGFIAIKILFTKPKAFLRLLKNLKKQSDKIDDSGEYAELYSIGVEVSKQGLGIGKMLLVNTEEELRTKNIYKLSLTTDLNDNESVISFYRKQGFDELYKFTSFPNRKMIRFFKNTKLDV